MAARHVLITAADSVPHSLLLADCNGITHHGAETCAAVLTAGLPPLCATSVFDQFLGMCRDPGHKQQALTHV